MVYWAIFSVWPDEKIKMISVSVDHRCCLGWLLHYHITLCFYPGAAIFRQHMLFDLAYLTDWRTIWYKHPWLVNDANDIENTNHINHDYAIGDKVLIINKVVDYKTRDKYLRPFAIIHVHTNGTVRIQQCCITECIIIVKLVHYFEKKGQHLLLEALHLSICSAFFYPSWLLFLLLVSLSGPMRGRALDMAIFGRQINFLTLISVSLSSFFLGCGIAGLDLLKCICLFLPVGS